MGYNHLADEITVKRRVELIRKMGGAQAALNALIGCGQRGIHLVKPTPPSSPPPKAPENGAHLYMAF